MRTTQTALITTVVGVLLIIPAMTFAQSAASEPSVTVPRLIQITGVFQPVDGQPPSAVEIVTLSVYAEADGGLPVWQERQTVAIEKTTGRFTLLLGASHPAGIPAEVFASGDAQWMSLLFERAGEREQARVRIASVPYALKASDAETLGGLPASAYLRAPTAARAEGGSRETSTLTSAADAVTESSIGIAAVLPGTTNFLAKYVNASDVGNSAVYETPTANVPTGAVGIGTTNPFDQLHLRFNNTNGAITGLAVQNLGNTSTSYSGMLFFDQNGALAQFQGFNNVTHEYRINNIATTPSINFMLGGASRFKINNTVGTTMTGAVGILAGVADDVGLLVDSSGSIGIGVQNTNPSGIALFADSASGFGTLGLTDHGTGVSGVATDPAGWAGFFEGDATVTGTLFKGGGAFRIDHPLDPENKYLSHSFVESPDMKNIYDGVAVFDGAGEAIVTLPDWFEALNGDFRYQLTPMGAAFVPYIADEITGNQFKIAGGISGRKVSWQVTGIRRDAFANANRIQVEEMKPTAAVGTYLHPESFAQPVEKGRPATTVADSKGSAKERTTGRADEMKARLRAISQKPAKR
jgi:hypothetical protein